MKQYNFFYHLPDHRPGNLLVEFWTFLGIFKLAWIIEPRCVHRTCLNQKLSLEYNANLLSPFSLVLVALFERTFSSLCSFPQFSLCLFMDQINVRSLEWHLRTYASISTQNQIRQMSQLLETNVDFWGFYKLLHQNSSSCHHWILNLLESQGRTCQKQRLNFNKI